MKYFLPLVFFLCSYPGISAQVIKVMSYNLRVDFGGDGENNWEFRREFLANQVSYNEPDFMGIQEGRIHQLTYIDSTLTHHSFIGRGRDDSETQGEYSAIFYNTDKFKLVSQSTFWLSETPDKVSKGWDAAYERVCTYGLFEDKTSKKRFYVFNTHMDHMGETARKNGAKLILDKIKAINTRNLPVILTGDFNCETNSEAYLSISRKMNDTRKVSQTKPFGPEGTFNGFKFHEPVKLLIDYIFVSKNSDVLKFAVLSDSKDCKYPSDHFPILTEIALK